MSKRYLKYESEYENPLVDEYGVIKQPTSIDKKRILLFENRSFSKSNNIFRFSDLEEGFIESLDVMSGDYVNILSKYRLVFYVNHNGYSKCTLEYDIPYSLSSGTVVRTYCPIISSNTLKLSSIEYESAYGGQIYVVYLDDTINLTITCYLEEL